MEGPRSGGEVPGSLVGELRPFATQEVPRVPIPTDVLPGRRLPKPVQQFLRTEASGGIVLLGAALVAVLWANSPWQAGYTTLWHTDVSLGVGRYVLREDLQHWVNDALMAIFFFVVGLEIKQELIQGSLRDPRVASMPAIAALGGMVVPALVYVAVTAGGAGAKGWGIPMATDIAFAVGVVALVGTRVPPALRVFLLTLAIVDDIGAIIVIGFFYSSGVRPGFLGLAALIVLAIVVVNRAGVVWTAPYIALGGALWLATYVSGVHATIAGVVLGLLTPARRFVPATVARGWASDLEDDPSAADLATMTRLAQHSVSPAERLGHILHPWSSFLVVPVFALANAGVTIKHDSFSAPGAVAVAAGVMLGLVAGKTAGIAGAAWLAHRLGVARLPEDTSWPMLVAVAGVAGIGFTVSLFVAGLAFDVGPLQDAARLGVLAASVVAATAGGTALWWTAGHKRPADAEPPGPA